MWEWECLLCVWILASCLLLCIQYSFSLYDHMLFLHRNLLLSRHRWICGYCSLNEKCSIFGFVFLMLNMQAQTWFTAYLLQNLFWRQNCSFLLLWQPSLQYPYYHSHEGMKTRPALHTNHQAHPVSSCLSSPVVALTSRQHVQGDITVFLPLSSPDLCFASQLWEVTQ